MGQLGLIEYIPRATGSVRFVLYGVTKEQVQSPWHTLLQLTHYQATARTATAAQFSGGVALPQGNPVNGDGKPSLEITV